MNPALSQFSDWTLALLPRLLLYPGGLWALAGLLALRLLSGGLHAANPRSLEAIPVHSERLPAALTWAALALLPLPGSAPLPSPPDRFSLVLLLLLSLAASWDASRGGIEQGINIPVVLASLAPLAGGRGLLSEGDKGLSGWLALAAVVVGLLALWEASSRDLASGLRWLAWLGIAAAPLWRGLPMEIVPGLAWVSALYALFIVGTALLGRRIAKRGRYRGLLLMCWGLAALSLLAALLA